MSTPLNTCNTVDLLENSSVFTTEIDKYQAQAEFDHKNLKKILLIVEKIDFLSANNEKLLRNIVKAIHLDWNDISIISLRSNETIALSKLIEYNDIEHVVMFGLPFDNIAINIDTALNKMIQIRGCCVTKTFNLKDLDSTKAKKAALWSTLQAQFKISA
ncbi:MAG: hypothetical protein HKN22_01730 [Bacteroidia bacterium]|nr:hypothetical protein [Bacteroidia bacterium]